VPPPRVGGAASITNRRHLFKIPHILFKIPPILFANNPIFIADRVIATQLDLLRLMREEDDTVNDTVNPADHSTMQCVGGMSMVYQY
jgi:hypothetical protein